MKPVFLLAFLMVMCGGAFLAICHGEWAKAACLLTIAIFWMLIPQFARDIFE